MRHASCFSASLWKRIWRLLAAPLDPPHPYVHCVDPPPPPPPALGAIPPTIARLAPLLGPFAAIRALHLYDAERRWRDM